MSSTAPSKNEQLQSTVTGWVDGFHRGRVMGWAVDTSRPDARLMVELVAGSGRVVGRVRADRYRADVHSQGYGDGHCGFAIPARWLESIPDPRFYCSQPRVELKGFASAPSQAGATMFEHAGLVIHLDQSPTSACITGWALDRHNPNQRRQLQLRAGSRVLGGHKATLYRADSTPEGGDGFHGFHLSLPANRVDLFIDDVISGSEFHIS